MNAGCRDVARSIIDDIRRPMEATSSLDTLKSHMELNSASNNDSDL